MLCSGKAPRPIANLSSREERDLGKTAEFVYFRSAKGKFFNSSKEEEGMPLYTLQALGMNDDLWNRVRGFVV